MLSIYVLQIALDYVSAMIKICFSRQNDDDIVFTIVIPIVPKTML